ncbi:hypothetical protein V6Z12_D06G042700 [Gossypium hirsutum]
MEAMRQDMNEQVLRFAEEKQDLESLSKELERRAIIAEAALKRARLNYSIAVGQLQKDLELLSSQVMSVFETNENLIRQAFVDSSQTNSRGYSEMVRNHGLYSEEFQPTKPLHSQNQYVGVKKQHLGGDILLEDLKRSLHLQETLYQKVEEEVCEMHYQNVYLDVFSNTLQDTLLEASDEMKTMKEKMDELTWKLELSVESKELLMQRLQTATDDVHSLNEYKATCIAKYNDLALEKQALEANVENVTHENHLLSEKVTELECHLMEYQSYKSKFDACVMEKTELANLLKEGTLENDNLRNNNSSLQDELRMIKTEFDELNLVKEKLQNTVDFLRNKFLNLLSSYGKFFDEPSLSSDLVCQDRESMDLTSVIVERQRDLLSDLQHFEAELQELTSKNKEIAEELLVLESVNEDLGSSKLIVAELVEENKTLVQSLQDKSEEAAELALELNGLKESLHSVHDELQAERSTKNNLESMVTDLTSQMNEKHHQLLQFDQQNSELAHLKKMLFDLESEKSRVCSLLQQYDECLNNAHKESSTITSLESEFVIFLRTQYETWTTDLVCQLSSSERHLGELQEKHLNFESILNDCLAREAHCIEENRRLSVSLDSLKSELEASMAENKVLLNKNSSAISELQDYKSRIEKFEFAFFEDKHQHALEVERLKHLLGGSQEEIDDLMILKEGLELNVLVLKAKLDEQSTQISLLVGRKDEVLLLQNQCNELSQRLSEQILKTEEFKNLSIHLKELKDKADAESIQAREKRESEAPPTAMQESLRIAFIKEQYETRLQELKHQLAISKKHSEEMLWKLQDAIDEIENRKKSEASHLKKIEELGVKILELEAELQSLVLDKREKMRAYDLMKAELDCSMISLECCKEEKEKLEASLQECKEEKSRISVELSIVKELLEASTSTMNVQKEKDGKLKDGCFSDELVVNNAQTRDIDLKYLDQDTPKNSKDADDGICLSKKQMKMHLVLRIQLHYFYFDDLVSNDTHEVHSQALVIQCNLPNSDAKHLALINDRFKAQSLRSSMDHLTSELERMKNENLVLSKDAHHFDTKFPGLQQELMQLDKVNEELGSIFPMFNEYSETGNALERVLALELELAEALQTKKSSILFQSSFLKQHNDEEAVFKSFRDINELIKNMLEIKGRYGAVETELKEMHERYSQLSLQFAEVEGERQKLMMTLKNVRALRKGQNLIRSSSASPGDHS